MRGIEGALSVLSEVGRGAFASESLRNLGPNIAPTERRLAGTLVYLTLRKQKLWKHLAEKYCRRPITSLHPETMKALTLGIAGVLELENFKPGVLVNALVEHVKGYGDVKGESALVNAVLRAVMREAPSYIRSLEGSSALRDQALVCGTPGWVAMEWNKDWGMKDAKALMRLSTEPKYQALRASPGLDRESWVRGYENHSAMPSDLFESAIRVVGNPYPPDLPGYEEGQVTPESESSIWAVETLLLNWEGDSILDMCCGRGVKASHILSYRPEAKLEGWNISSGQMRSAEAEMARLGVRSRASLRLGDALVLQPQKPPQAILLDVPCTGSGTWGRRPEGKWRSSREKLLASSQMQKQLFERAVGLLAPGGVIMYCTCSVFREENEKVVGAVLSGHQDLVELPVRTRLDMQRRGKPYGALLWPNSPWIDGFYVAMFRKRMS